MARRLDFQKRAKPPPIRRNGMKRTVRTMSRTIEDLIGENSLLQPDAKPEPIRPFSASQ
jgi:hypothetical protein